MNLHREKVISQAAVDAKLPEAFAHSLFKDCPWLDGIHALGEQIGFELLQSEAMPFSLDKVQVLEFIERYNAIVKNLANPSSIRQTEAYVEIGNALSVFGRADAFGEGDYWLISDTFSTRAPVIQVFDRFRFSPKAIATLQSILNLYASTFAELRIDTEFGAEVVTLRPH